MGNTASADGGSHRLLGCCTEGHGRSMRSAAKNPSSQEPHSLSCGIGVGLDPTLIAERKGAIVIALADGGAAHKEGGIQLGDRIIKIDTLDVVKMMEDDRMYNADSNGAAGTSSYCATELASALLGEYGSRVDVVVERNGKTCVTSMRRSPLPRGCQWIREAA